ncbi:hypothetical protein MPER_01345 [Moniliophthora perniciosa FA553]|nr:hypothetical protein MPER_01345 [Moniliophthora perniciosa FA553]
MTISPSVHSQAAGTTAPSQYQSSVYAASVAGTTSGSSVRKAPFTLPPLLFGRSMTPPPLSPQSHDDVPAAPGRIIHQTPLQRHLAHLARHGINGVSSAPGENFGSDSVSAGSPHDSFVNVGNGIHGGGGGGVQASNASVVTSNPGGSGSLVSLGSIRGRISRFGSLNFGRRG